MIKIYTDGSSLFHRKKKGLWRSSWAFIIQLEASCIQGNGLIKIGDINVAELTAVIEGLKTLGKTDDEVIIYTDSTFVEECFNSKVFNNKYVSLVNQLWDLTRDQNVKIIRLEKQRSRLHWEVHILARQTLNDYLSKN